MEPSNHAAEMRLFEDWVFDAVNFNSSATIEIEGRKCIPLFSANIEKSESNSQPMKILDFQKLCDQSITGYKLMTKKEKERERSRMRRSDDKYKEIEHARHLERMKDPNKREEAKERSRLHRATQEYKEKEHARHLERSKDPKYKEKEHARYLERLKDPKYVEDVKKWSRLYRTTHKYKEREHARHLERMKDPNKREEAKERSRLHRASQKNNNPATNSL